MDPRPPEKKRQAGRRRVRLPAVARVPKPSPAKRLRKDASAIAAEAVATTAARLRDVAARIQAGDTSRLAAVYPRGIGTTVRGLSADECGQYYTVKIEGVECHHYLPDNRLCWWETWEQKFRLADPQIRTGAVSGSERGPEEVFLCEFSPALATVVGAGLPSPGMLQYGLSYDYLTWELFHDGVSLNAFRLSGSLWRRAGQDRSR